MAPAVDTAPRRDAPYAMLLRASLITSVFAAGIFVGNYLPVVAEMQSAGLASDSCIPPPPPPPPGKPPPPAPEPSPKTGGKFPDVANILVDPTSFPAFTEFDTRRAVVLLTKDAPTLDVRVGFYTQVLGTKRGQQVKVNSVTAPSNHVGGSTHTFMRSAERLHVAKSSVWSTSQGCALRNCKFDGDLKLSASTQDWGSGGFLSDLFVTGTLDTGIQQQHIVKASKIGALKASPSSWNLLFVGVDGVPKPTAAEERYIESARDGRGLAPLVQPRPPPSHTGVPPPLPSQSPPLFRVAVAGEVAEGTQQKPYLEEYFGTWEIIVPKAKTQLSGFESAPETEKINVHKECEVWSVASNSSKGNAPKSTHSKCVIIAPGVYTIDTPIIFDRDDAVILGLGFATFECTTHEQCVTIKGDRVSVSGLVLDAGYTSTPIGLHAQTRPPTIPAPHPPSPPPRPPSAQPSPNRRNRSSTSTATTRASLTSSPASSRPRAPSCVRT